MADEKKSEKGGGDIEAAYQELMGTLDGAYTNTVDKEPKKETKKDAKAK